VGKKRSACGGFMVKPDRKRPLGRPRPMREENNKTELQDTECDDVDWNCLP
jgi:hypothetical protein